MPSAGRSRRRSKPQPDLLRNGVVRVTFGKKGWKFGFDADNATLIEDGTLDFWIDNQNRGRILNIGPEKLGLARFADCPRREDGSVRHRRWPTVAQDRAADGRTGEVHDRHRDL